MEKVVDLRSDTLTCPDAEMREAMAKAVVGDDCHGEDPTVNELEQLAAERIGKGTALYVPTGTMGNSIGIWTLTGGGGVVIAETYNHVGYYEREGIEKTTNVKFLLYNEPSGVPEPRLIERMIKDARKNGADVRAVAFENTFNVRGGVCIPVKRMTELCDLAHSHGLKVHLDGARVFNAATYLGCDVKDLVHEVDTVMFCLSKGLGAPVGSMIASDEDARETLHRRRKMLGGGMRQAGVIAAPGIVALKRGPGRLAEDHKNARLLAEGLSRIHGICVDLDRVQTNIVMMHLESARKADELDRRARARGVKFLHFWDGMCRLVTYNAITAEDVQYAVAIIGDIMGEMKS